MWIMHGLVAGEIHAKKSMVFLREYESGLIAQEGVVVSNYCFGDIYVGATGMQEQRALCGGSILIV